MIPAILITFFSAVTLIAWCGYTVVNDMDRAWKDQVRSNQYNWWDE